MTALDYLVGPGLAVPEAPGAPRRADDAVTYVLRKRAGHRPETWTLDADKLTLDGKLVADLSSVRAGSFSDMPSGQHWVSTLVLDHSRGSTKITCKDIARGQSRSEFMSLVMAILGDLAIVRPEAAFRAGGGRIMTWALAVIGGLMSGVGLYFCIFGLFEQSAGLSEFKLTMGSLAILFGLFLLWTGAPWSKPTSRSPRELYDWLRTWLSHSRAAA